METIKEHRGIIVNPPCSLKKHILLLKKKKASKKDPKQKLHLSNPFIANLPNNSIYSVSPSSLVSSSAHYPHHQSAQNLPNSNMSDINTILTDNLMLEANKYLKDCNNLSKFVFSTDMSATSVSVTNFENLPQLLQNMSNTATTSHNNPINVQTAEKPIQIQLPQTASYPNILPTKPEHISDTIKDSIQPSNNSLPTLQQQQKLILSKTTVPEQSNQIISSNTKLQNNTISNIDSNLNRQSNISSSATNQIVSPENSHELGIETTSYSRISNHTLSIRSDSKSPERLVPKLDLSEFDEEPKGLYGQYKEKIENLFETKNSNDTDELLSQTDQHHQPRIYDLEEINSTYFQTSSAPEEPHNSNIQPPTTTDKISVASTTSHDTDLIKITKQLEVEDILKNLAINSNNIEISNSNINSAINQLTTITVQNSEISDSPNNPMIGDQEYEFKVLSLADIMAAAEIEEDLSVNLKNEGPTRHASGMSSKNLESGYQESLPQSKPVTCDIQANTTVPLDSHASRSHIQGKCGDDSSRFLLHAFLVKFLLIILVKKYEQ